MVGFGDQPGSNIAVEITARHRVTRAEAVIETVRRQHGKVEVDVLLSDGRDATARLSSFDWEWLELAPGDIVPIRHLGEDGLSA